MVEKIELVQQIYAIIDIITPYANMNNVTLEIQHLEDQLYVSANPTEIKQLFINFIKNAIEACAVLPSGNVNICIERQSKFAKIAIIDNGVGMSIEQMDRLGSIYFSTKSKGTGLGLTLSYQLIRSMNGDVTVRSKSGEGTQFILTLPLFD